MRRTRVISILLVGTACWLAKPAVHAEPTSSTLTIEKLIDIKHPSGAVWSPDGKHVAFVWERAGIQNLFVSDPASQAAPRALTAFPAGDIGGHFWSGDSSAVYFGRGGDLWRVGLDGSPAAAVWTTKGSESQITPSPDRTRVAFVRDGDIWLRALNNAVETRLTSTPDIIEGGPAWSPDGARIVFSAAKVARKEYAPEYSGAKILYTVTERTPLDLEVVSASGGSAAPVTLAPNPALERAARWLDATHLVYERVSQDTTTREIVIADATTGEGRVVVREEDKKWWSVTPSAQPSPQPSPDGRWIAFISDRDGWDRVYVLPASAAAATDAAEPAPISPPNREAWRPTWSSDSTHIVFDSNGPGAPGVRHLFSVAIANGRASGAPIALTSGRGTNIAAVISPDGRSVVYQHTDPHNSADLFVAQAALPATTAQPPAPLRLTDSLPATIDRAKLIEPTLIAYPSSDGKRVPAYLFLPPNFDKSKKYPAIVWIHGDGVNQNYDGWHVERNYAVYYSFHQYLLQQGYVVLTPDYRGSIGYGRDWRQGVFLDVGGKDYEDAELGAKYLKSLGYVDGERIGVWGLSYGGFFTLQAVTQAPKDFACAVDVAGVADYAMYYDDPYHGAWTYGRMRAPEDHPKEYAAASPLSHMDRLERPLLILHGTADVNVPYLHSIRLVDTLLKLKKDYEFITYPGEFHYFTREHVLRDAWSKVDRFFARYLKPPAPPVTSEP